jgi:hypothetical protein
MRCSKGSRGSGKSRETGQAVTAEESVRNSNTTSTPSRQEKVLSIVLDSLHEMIHPIFPVLRVVAVGLGEAD